MFVKFCILFLLATLAATIDDDDDDKINTSSNFQQQKQNKNQKCQSGLREDNTNYIYCARQSLRLIPNLNHMDSGGGNGGISGNGIYDELVLSDNLIEHIDAQTFGTTFKVKKLYLDVNPLKTIHVDSFKHLRNYLEEIYFELKKTLTPTNENNDDNDAMAIFDQSILRTCFNLRLLSIKTYTIHLLDGYKLARLTKLETLSITNSKLKFIDEFAFVGVENSLLELNLNSNLLDVIPTNSLERLRRLRRLNLAQNAIKHVHANAFFRVTSSLHTLDLSYNLVKRIDENAFNGPVQNSLKILLMQNNELKWTNFVHLLYNLRWLQELNVDFNKLGIMMMGQMKNSTYWVRTKTNI
jgi:Leucine-rich repeat (LRR) protein